MSDRGKTLALLGRIEQGDDDAVALLMPLVYEDLRAAAARQLGRQRRDHTLQPTALVNETFLKLSSAAELSWGSRSHFMALAARAMGQVLANHARDRAAVKRGAGRPRVTLHEEFTPATSSELELGDLSDALEELRSLNERQARVVEMRFFGGLAVKEVAHVLDVSSFTVEQDWRVARAWLGNRFRAYRDRDGR